MTAERSSRRRLLGPLGRRLLAAFAVVSLGVSALTALVGLLVVGTSLAHLAEDTRAVAAQRAAHRAGEAYAAAGGWRGADLGPAQELADTLDAELTVRDAAGSVVRAGPEPAEATVRVSEPVVVGGRTVGTVETTFPRDVRMVGQIRDILVRWLLLAAALSVTLMLVATTWVTNRLTRPLRRLTAATNRIAGGAWAVPTGWSQEPGEIGELSAAVDTLARTVVDREARRRRVAADVAHELRRPVTALRASLEELADGLVEPSPARCASLLDQSVRLGRVLDELTELYDDRTTAPPRLAPVDVAAVARAAVDATARDLSRAGLRVSVDVAPAWASGDADRLLQVLTNLLDNVAKHCRAGDGVTVRAGVADGDVFVEVGDTGPGIPADELPHVFERLYRGRVAAGRAGSGIGLAVARKVVDEHGGRIEVASEPGRGTTFRVVLPAAAQAAGATSDAPACGTSGPESACAWQA